MAISETFSAVGCRAFFTAVAEDSSKTCRDSRPARLVCIRRRHARVHAHRGGVRHRGIAVQVEVDVSFGLPCFTMVGLPDTASGEPRSCRAARSAIPASSSRSTASRSTLHLPTFAKRDRASTCPLRWGCWPRRASRARRDVDDVLLIGELSLDGGHSAGPGVLPIAAAARRDGYRGLLLPRRTSARPRSSTGSSCTRVRRCPKRSR